MTAPATSAHGRTDNDSNTDVLDVLIVGGGFSGLYSLDRLRDAGFTAKVWDAAGDFGGIWWWNCYPGARTDSTGQVYQFEHKELWRDFDWRELYPNWEGVREYFQYIDSQLDLRKDVVFSTFASEAAWDEDSRTWTVRSSDGKEQQARQVIVATGFGAKPLYPNLEGLDTFAGESYHTARWPQGGVDMTGKKVVVMGTGSSGVQVVQEAGHVAEHVTVLQRTPNLALPMQQRKLTHDDNEEFRKDLPERFVTRNNAFAGFDFDFMPINAVDLSKEERDAIYEKMWQEGGFPMWLGTFQDILSDDEANRTFYDFWRNKVHERIADPVKAEIVAPKEWPHPYGIKRPSLEQDYYDVINQDNVDVIDSKKNPIKKVVPEGVIMEDGTFLECDLLVLATGFDANSGGILGIDITGVDGQKLRDKWAGGVDTFMGLSTNGFPNMMFLYGPQSPSGFCNGPTSAERQGHIVVEFLEHLQRKGVTRFENSVESEKSWRSHVDELFMDSMFPRAKSWYWGANVPGKVPQMLNYTGGVPLYFTTWDEHKENGYDVYDVK
ncbi:flavin-containing monooxygenase [Gordonia hydrophobica]|uniref:NAD(P)/FAD-dependent oxidoreductase n=1 Tax=Gordonia hydrophobica TaxID=40516 RepID=A0ABZ2TXZ6_9ACTN|nr:NAD(P)/FAD-dependent oxidoreductase [Gordonia hydrophobica]MBM7366564.1 cyclohexanone monooxygenase [Gordonia hydrophobica]